MEEAWTTRFGADDSVHLHDFFAVPADWANADLIEKWKRIRELRRVVTGALELARADKTIGSSLEAAPVLVVDRTRRQGAVRHRRSGGNRHHLGRVGRNLGQPGWRFTPCRMSRARRAVRQGLGRQMRPLLAGAGRSRPIPTPICATAAPMPWRLTGARMTSSSRARSG